MGDIELKNHQVNRIISNTDNCHEQKEMAFELRFGRCKGARHMTTWRHRTLGTAGMKTHLAGMGTPGSVVGSRNKKKLSVARTQYVREKAKKRNSET